jgi:hypothetical protein
MKNNYRKRQIKIENMSSMLNQITNVDLLDQGDSFDQEDKSLDYLEAFRESKGDKHRSIGCNKKEVQAVSLLLLKTG